MGLFPRDRNLARAPREIELEVRASDFQLPVREVEIRLDAFLKRALPWRSRTSIQRLIHEGRVTVECGGGPEGRERTSAVELRAARVLRHGARIVVEIPPELLLDDSATDSAALSILYEDESVLAVDKPANLAVHPSGRHLTDTLIQRVHARYTSERKLAVPLRLCHRLDRETSGVVLVAKGERSHRALSKQFERREVEKEYLAIVRGIPAEDEGMVDLPLGSALAGRVHLKMVVREDGAPSRTEWTVVERQGKFALVSCRPLTGRQHQIRVHLASIGHPIVGDKLYGEDDELFLRGARQELRADDLRVLDLPRHALHSHRLGWRDPTSGARREATSPLPADLRDFLTRAGRGQGAPI
jgi:23S rRNA pseudouridine1911/1915/1917 synthase